MDWKKFRNTQTAGYLFISLGILNWSGNFAASRGLAGQVEPGTVNLMRWALASLVFLPFGARALWRERHAALKVWKELLLISLCGVSLYDSLIFLAGHTSEALNMSLISTLSPLLTALVAQFILKEPMRSRMYVGIGVSTMGVALLVTDGDLTRLLTLRLAQGDVIILCTAMMSAAYNTVIKRVTGSLSQQALLMACCLLGTLELVPIHLWETGGRFVFPALTPTLVWTLVYLSVFASILCYLFWNMAVEVLGAPKTSLFYYTLPPTSAVVAWVTLGEAVNRNQILSGLIILAGILFALYGGAPKLRGREVKTYGQPSEVAH